MSERLSLGGGDMCQYPRECRCESCKVTLPLLPLRDKERALAEVEIEHLLRDGCRGRIYLLGCRNCGKPWKKGGIISHHINACVPRPWKVKEIWFCSEECLCSWRGESKEEYLKGERVVQASPETQAMVQGMTARWPTILRTPVPGPGQRRRG